MASGRFGVTPEYIMNADQLEIKVAQVGLDSRAPIAPNASMLLFWGTHETTCSFSRPLIDQQAFH